MTTRHDVSLVPPQGGYIAKQCPVRVQNDVLQPTERLPAGPDAQLRMQQGIDFEAEVIAALRKMAQPSWVFIEEDAEREEAIAGTMAAMSSGAELIAGGWLPEDEAGRRVGKPDLLVRAGDGYVPVDVKHHLTLDEAEEANAETSPLEKPHPETAEPRVGWCRRKSKTDALQLAHYRRMLEAVGHAADSSHAGIIGKEKVVVWYDLDEPLWQTPAKSDGKKRKMRTSMEIYDFEFSFRLDIAAVAQQSLRDASVGLLVEPVRCGECPDCPWREHCNAILLSGSGDPSLLPWVGFREWRALREEGITDRRGVAELHYPTARLGADGVNLGRLLEAAAETEGDLAVAELLGSAKKQIELVTAQGLATAGEVLASIDRRTARLGSASFLPTAILNARAAVGEAPVYRRPGLRSVAVPRADLELDIDMESVNDGVYLWGVLATDRGGGGVESTYRPFASWDSLDESAELELFRGFRRWLTNAIGEAEAAGRSVLSYCWWAGAENSEMRRIAAADPKLAAEVDAFIDSERWVDMERVFRGGWISGESNSLKVVAPLAGYEWVVDEPGGGMAMVRYEEATKGESAEAREEARDWLLDYNRGDVEATRRIREWLDAEGAGWPQLPVEGWGG